MKLTLGTFFLLTVLSMGTAFVSPTPVAAGEPGGLVACTGLDCNFCTFVETVDNVIDLLFEILVVVAVIMIVVVGLKLATSGGNVNAMQQSKEMLTNVIIGFVIVLSAWLIVDTVIKILVGEGSKFGQWNELSTGDCGKSRSDGLYTGPYSEVIDSYTLPEGGRFGDSDHLEWVKSCVAQGGKAFQVGRSNTVECRTNPSGDTSSPQENNSPSTNTGNASTDTASADDTSSPRDTAPPPVEEPPDLTGTIYEIPCGSAVGCTIFCENGDLSLEAFPRVNSNTGDVQYYRQCQVR